MKPFSTTFLMLMRNRFSDYPPNILLYSVPIEESHPGIVSDSLRRLLITKTMIESQH